MVHRSSRTSVTPTDVKCVSCTDHIAVLRQEVGPVDPNETLKTIRALVDRTNAYGDEALDAALSRLDFLERKVMAADRLRDEARYGSPSLALRLAVQDYDEVTE